MCIFKRCFGGHAADSNRICDMSNRSFLYDLYTAFLSLRDNGHSDFRYVTSHILLLMCFQHLCAASGKPKLLIIGTFVELIGLHHLWIGNIKSSSAPYVNFPPFSTDCAGK